MTLEHKKELIEIMKKASEEINKMTDEMKEAFKLCWDEEK